MLVVPLIGGRLVTHLGWRRHFALSLAIIAAGDLVLLAATWRAGAAETLALILAGMVMIGIGAALAHPQLSGSMLALTPPDRTGVASVETIKARQGGFALGIAAPAVVGGAQAFWALCAAVAATACLGALSVLCLLPADR